MYSLSVALIINILKVVSKTGETRVWAVSNTIFINALIKITMGWRSEVDWLHDYMIAANECWQIGLNTLIINIIID